MGMGALPLHIRGCLIERVRMQFLLGEWPGAPAGGLLLEGGRGLFLRGSFRCAEPRSCMIEEGRRPFLACWESYLMVRAWREEAASGALRGPPLQQE